MQLKGTESVSRLAALRMCADHIQRESSSTVAYKAKEVRVQSVQEPSPAASYWFSSVSTAASSVFLASRLWRLYGDGESKRERFEERALRIVGVHGPCRTLPTTLIRREADESLTRIALVAVSLVIMPLLVRAKRHVAGAIGSAAFAADAAHTEICTYLSAIVLGGLLLNATFGCWVGRA